jgi:copper chaperone CopZ
MSTLKFKTNIKCGACVATVTPSLNTVVGEGNWSVDLQSPDRTLTVDSDTATNAQITQALKDAGYSGEIVA